MFQIKEVPPPEHSRALLLPTKIEKLQNVCMTMDRQRQDMHSTEITIRESNETRGTGILKPKLDKGPYKQ